MDTNANQNVVMTVPIHRSESILSPAATADLKTRLPLNKTLAFGRFLLERAQDIPLDLFTKLEAGDVLFIDTSHVLKIQSDVEHELNRILPSLAPGV